MQTWLAYAATVEAVLISFLIALWAASVSLRWIFLLMPSEKENSARFRSAADHRSGARHGPSGRLTA
jgi:hypothetical protein